MFEYGQCSFTLRRAAAWALLLSISAVSSAWAAEADYSCHYGLKDAPSDVPKFSDYPARVEHIAKPAPLALLGNKEARSYRTVLRTAAETGPNFAGHYTIADVGCGSSCSHGAVIDEATGRVNFPPAMEIVSGVRADDYRLQYRVNSSLLIVLGGVHEDEAHGGIFYYRWDGKNLHLLRFVPADKICTR
jgi:hypothetical protein